MTRRFVDALAFAALVFVGTIWSATAFGQAGVSGPSTGTGYPNGSTPQVLSVQATTAGIATGLVAGPGQWTYLCGISVSAGTATAAITVTVTVTNIASGNMVWSVNSPVTAATATAGPDLTKVFTPCLRANGINVGPGLAVSALGAGGVSQSASIWGYNVPAN